MLLWATGSILLINRAEVWTRPAPGDKPKDILFIGITIASFLVVSALHAFLAYGHSLLAKNDMPKKKKF